MNRLATFLVLATLACGCASKKPVIRAAAPAPARSLMPAIVTPDTSLSAKVVSYNAEGRFAVLAFPIGPMPKIEQHFFVYRDGLKVGEVKITGPQRDNNIVADLVTGEARPGDEVREQ